MCIRDSTSTVNFRVLARRADARGERDVVLPYFVTVVRGGNVVISKRIGEARLHFADGQLRAETTASGSAVIDRKEATLDTNARARITKERKAVSYTHLDVYKRQHYGRAPIASRLCVA